MPGRPGWGWRVPGRAPRLVPALLLTLVLAVPASGQMRAGLRGGLSLAAMVTDPEDLGFRTGGIGGGWLRVPLGGPVALQIEGYYVQKGFEEEASSIADASLGVQLDYFEFPLLLTFLVNRGEPRMLYAAVGGAFALERGCTVEATAGGFSGEVDCERLAAETEAGFHPEDFDVGLILGLGGEFEAGSVILTLDARADLGLTDAMAFTTAGGPDDDFGGQNVAIEIMAGVAFPLR